MTTPGPPQLELDRFLPYRLSILTNRVSQGLADLYSARYGISITQWRVIAVLGREAALSANEVAARTAMDKVAVSRALAHLVNMKLLKRRRHPADQRRSVLHLSAAGQRIYAEVAPLALAYEQRLLAALDADEQAALDHLLSKLAAGIAVS